VFNFNNINWALLDQALVSGVNFLSGILLARLLGLTDYGVFTLLWMMVLFLNNIQYALIMSPMMSLRPETYNISSRMFYSSFSVLQLVYSFASLIVVASVMVVLSGIDAFGISSDVILPLVCVTVFYQVQEFFRRYFFSNKMFVVAFTSDVISYFGQIVLFILAAYLNEFSLVTALWLIACTSLIAILYSIPRFVKISIDIDVYKMIYIKNWSYSKWLVATSIMQWFSGHFFIFITGIVLGVTSVGAVKSALNIVGVLHILFQGLENVIPVEASKWYIKHGAIKLQSYISQVLLYTVLGTIAISIPILLFPKDIMGYLYGNSFVEYYYLLYWCVAIYVVMSFGLSLKVALRTINSTRSIFIAQSITGVITLFTSYMLADMFGLHGVMFGLLLINIVFISVLYFSYKKTIKMKLTN